MAGDDDNVVTTPYYDAFDDYGDFFEAQLQNFVTSPNPNLNDLSYTEEYPPPPPPPIQPMEINETDVLKELSLSIDDIEDILRMPFVYDDLATFNIPSDDLNIDNFLRDDDNSNNIGETSGLEVGGASAFEIGVSSTMLIPADITPITSIKPSSIHLCSCCNSLREIIHSNGQETMRLDIHGGIGFFCHATIEYRRFDGSNEYQTVHLKGLKMEEVKKFIEDYCSEREACDFATVQDTHAEFYQAISACSSSNEEQMSRFPSGNDDVTVSLVLPNEALDVPPLALYVGLRDESSPAASNRERRKPLTPLAVQRERTGKLTLKDIGMYFHLPIEEAARRLNLCPTVVKKICRKGGLPRWPYRKIKSLQKKISSTRNVLETATDIEEKVDAEMEIERAQQEIDKICSESLKNCK